MKKTSTLPQKEKNVLDYFPETSRSITKENFSPSFLQVKYSIASKIVETIVFETGRNSIFVLSGKDAGTWMTAFGKNIEVSQVYVQTFPETSSFLENNRKLFQLTSKVNFYKELSNLSQNVQKNWNLFYLNFDEFSKSEIPKNFSRVWTYFFKSFPDFSQEGWIFESRNVPFSKIGILLGIPSQKKSTKKITFNKETTWLISLQKFLAQLFRPYFADDLNLIQILEQGPMNNIWTRVFTSSSFSREKNSETLEFIGDTRLADIFAVVLTEKMPSLNEAQLSSLTQYYMSEQFQPELSDKLGLTNFLRFRLPENSSKNSQDHFLRKAREDLFEAFIGGLSKLCNEFFGYDFSYRICLELMTDVFRDIEIDMSKSRGSEKTLFIEFFRRRGLPPPEFRTRFDEDGSSKTEILISQRTVNFFFEKYGIEVNRIFSTGSAKSKKDSENNAIENGFQFIRSKNISEKVEDFYNLETVREEAENLKIIFERNGFSNPRFEISPEKRITFVSLIVDFDETEKVLSVGEGTSKEEAQRDAIRRFISV